MMRILAPAASSGKSGREMKAKLKIEGLCVECNRRAVDALVENRNTEEKYV
jgi:hypothetical protein